MNECSNESKNCRVTLRRWLRARQEARDAMKNEEKKGTHQDKRVDGGSSDTVVLFQSDSGGSVAAEEDVS
jgi:hypothetical protein